MGCIVGQEEVVEIVARDGQGREDFVEVFALACGRVSEGAKGGDAVEGGAGLNAFSG